MTHPESHRPADDMLRLRRAPRRTHFPLYMHHRIHPAGFHISVGGRPAAKVAHQVREGPPGFERKRRGGHLTERKANGPILVEHENTPRRAVIFHKSARIKSEKV